MNQRSRCFENLSDEEKALAYGIVGGTPQYLMQLDDTRSMEENIKSMYLDPASPLFEEPTNLLKPHGASDLAYQRIAPELPAYMGGVFEDICRQYLWSLLLAGKCAVNFSELGRWWGTNPKTKSQEEIDIMGAEKNTALFGECKWTNEKVDVQVLETLVKRSALFHLKKVHFYLFAKTGFTKGCIARASALGSVTLVTYAEMLKNRPV